MLLALPFGMLLTGRLSPPAAGTANTFRNAFAVRPTYATHRLSGDHARPRGDRVRCPLASAFSCFDARSSRRNSLPSRTNAIDLPSGATLGAASPVEALVSCVSA